jgi:HK97 family phage portal protein
VADYVTPSGLAVTDRTHRRASEIPQIDPREHVPNGNVASTVGPESRAGDLVVGPASGWHAEAWAGWPDAWATPFYGEPWSGTGYGRDPTSSRVSTAVTCVDLNSRQLASFPTYGVKGSTPFTLPAWSTNPEPELYSSWSEFMHAVVNSLELRGEAFTYATARYADTEGGRPRRFAVLNPDAVGVEWIDGRREYLIDGDPVDRADVAHIKYQSWPGRLHGISPLEWSARSLATSGALERYASALATRGGVPWAVLKSPKNINAKQAEDAQNTWVAASQRRDGAPAVLGNAFELAPLSFSPRDMALLELREFDERRICAAFGVPGYLVNVAMADGLTYANASQLFLHHWTATLRPLAQMIAEVWSAWLLPAGSRLEFDPDRYVQPPPGERAATDAVLFGLVDPATGQRAKSIDEIRASWRFHPTDSTSSSSSGDDLVQVQRLTGGVV